MKRSLDYVDDEVPDVEEPKPKKQAKKGETKQSFVIASLDSEIGARSFINAAMESLQGTDPVLHELLAQNVEYKLDTFQSSGRFRQGRFRELAKSLGLDRTGEFHLSRIKFLEEVLLRPDAYDAVLLDPDESGPLGRVESDNFLDAVGYHVDVKTGLPVKDFAASKWINRLMAMLPDGMPRNPDIAVWRLFCADARWTGKVFAVTGLAGRLLARLGTNQSPVRVYDLLRLPPDHQDGGEVKCGGRTVPAILGTGPIWPFNVPVHASPVYGFNRAPIDGQWEDRDGRPLPSWMELDDRGMFGQFNVLETPYYRATQANAMRLMFKKHPAVLRNAQFLARAAVPRATYGLKGLDPRAQYTIAEHDDYAVGVLEGDMYQLHLGVVPKDKQLEGKEEVVVVGATQVASGQVPPSQLPPGVRPKFQELNNDAAKLIEEYLFSGRHGLRRTKGLKTHCYISGPL